MSKVTSLDDLFEGGGWVWTVDDDGTERRYRTNSDFEGLWVWVEDGLDVQWHQTRGHMQVSWPTDRAEMLDRLALQHDVSALSNPENPTTYDDPDAIWCTLNVVDGTLIVVVPGAEDLDTVTVNGRLMPTVADLEPWGEAEEDLNRAVTALAEMGWRTVGEWQSPTGEHHTVKVEQAS